MCVARGCHRRPRRLRDRLFFFHDLVSLVSVCTSSRFVSVTHSVTAMPFLGCAAAEGASALGWTWEWKLRSVFWFLTRAWCTVMVAALSHGSGDGMDVFSAGGILDLDRDGLDGIGRRSVVLRLPR